jgi:predicted DNA-binding protein (UPF0251 family)
MGRKRMWRKVSSLPQINTFHPAGISLAATDEVNLLVEEAEAVRLKDLEGMEQEQCAERMCVSRPTFARILDAARRKIADAILNGKVIRIEGGNFEMAVRRFRCMSGHEWDVPFETMVSTPPELCPDCETPSIMPIKPEGIGWNGPAGKRRS